MLETETQVQSHPFFAIVTQISNKIDQNEFEPHDPERWERFTQMAKLLNHNVLTSYPKWIPSFAVVEGYGHLKQCLNYLNEYIANPKNASALQNALQQCDMTLRHFPHPYRIKDPRTAHEIVAEMSDSKNEFSDLVAELEAKVAGLQDRVNRLHSDAKSYAEKLDAAFHDEKKRIETELTELNEQFQETQRNRSSEFTSSIDDFEQRKLAVIKAFNDQKGHFSETNDTQRERFSSDFDTFLAESKDRHAQVMQEAETFRDEIREIAGLSGAEAMVGDFHVQANKKDKIAGRYRWISYAGFVIAAAAMGYAFIAIAADAELKHVLARSQLAFILFVPSAFFAYEARKLQGEARAAREIELRIKSFPHFASSLNDEARTKLYQDMAPVFFGRATGADVAAGDSKEVFKFVERLIDKLTK
ncbi:MAG: hypothetical protein CMK09_10230 [Ponticaulis sp.]|nr:hypothetical protein [Ponticaulis sp.]|tara:strand:- start:3617 stop:4867 length:1251 start_codon:yes stop_codon:yes gene_type:complete